MAHLSPTFHFMLLRQLRNRRWWVALLVFFLIFGAGALWAGDKYDTFGDGVVVAVIVAVSFGIGRDRRTGFDLFLTNLVPPRVAVVSRLISVFTLYMALFAIVLLTAAVVWHDPALALWHAVYIFLVLALLLPLSFLLEIVLGIEIPVVLALLLFGLFMMYFVASAGTDATARIAFMGLDAAAGNFSSLRRLAYVNTIWNAGVIAAATAIWNLQHRLRGIRVNS